MKKLKVFVEGSKNYASWLNCEIVDNAEEANVIMFTGGSDINSEMYCHSSKHAVNPDKERDEYCVKLWNKFQKTHYFIGICRGAQLLHVLKGYYLIPDVKERLYYNHKIHILNGESFNVISDHHQMMYCHSKNTSGYKVIGWNSLSHDNYGVAACTGEIVYKKMEVEPEIVLYKNAIAIQFHPEWQKESKVHDFLNEVIYTNTNQNFIVEDYIL